MFLCYTDNHIRTQRVGMEGKLHALFRRKGRRIRRNADSGFSWTVAVLPVWLTRQTAMALSGIGMCKNQEGPGKGSRRWELTSPQIQAVAVGPQRGWSSLGLRFSLGGIGK